MVPARRGHGASRSFGLQTVSRPARGMVAQYQSQIEELQRDLDEYDALRSGRVASLDVDSLTALSDALIRARIAAGLTQKELAARLGLKEQQIQRYESTRYGGVSLARAQAVVDALGVRIHERLTLPTAEKASHSQT